MIAHGVIYRNERLLLTKFNLQRETASHATVWPAPSKHPLTVMLYNRFLYKASVPPLSDEHD